MIEGAGFYVAVVIAGVVVVAHVMALGAIVVSAL